MEYYDLYMHRSLFIALVFFFASAVRSETVLTLDDCIRMGLEGNLTLELQRIQLSSASADVMRVSAMYDPQLQLDGTFQDSELPPGSFPSQGGVERGQATARLMRGFSSGTTLGVELDVQRNLFEGMSAVDEPSYRTAAGITLRQSLWRNALGAGQRAQMDYTQQRLISLELEYTRSREQVATAIADEYWRALTAREIAATQQAVIERLQKLRANNQRLFEDGLLDESAVLAVDASLAVAGVDVEVLQNEAQALDERLKERIDLPVMQWDQTTIDYRLPGDTTPAPAMDFLDAYESALQNRADVEALRNEEERVASLIRWKQQEDRADLEVSAGIGRGDADPALGDSLDFDKTVWSVGVMLDMSLKRSGTRAEVMQALLARDRIRAEMELLERAIQLECRAAIRQVAVAERLVAATAKAREAQTKKLELEVQRFRRGQSDTKTLLDYENDLELAERDYLNARGTLERAQVALRFATGELVIRSAP